MENARRYSGLRSPTIWRQAMKGRALLKHMGTALAGTALAALVAFALPASANIYNFSTPSGALSFDGKPLDATAQFTTSAGQIQLILTNLQATSVASQLLSDISFTASGVAFSFATAEETSGPVPMPAAVCLFGSGLLGLLGIARRRQPGIVTASPVSA